MGTKKVVEPEKDEKTQEELDEEKAILKIIAETDDDLTVKIYRLDDKAVNGKIWLGDIPADAFSMQAISNKYGGGVYLINVLTKMGSFATRKKIQIGGLPKEEEKIEEIKTDNGNGDILKMMQMQLDSAQTRNDMLLQAIITGMNKDVPAPTSNNSLTDMLAMFTTFQGMIPKPVENTGSNFKEMLELVKLGSEMGGGGGDTNEMDILSKAIDGFAPLLKGAIEKSQPNQITEKHQEAGEMDINQIKMAINHLLQMKANGIDPENAAEFIKDKIPTLILNRILDVLRRVNWQEIVTSNVPKALESIDWLKKFRDALLRLTTVKMVDKVDAMGPSITGIDNATAQSIPIGASSNT